MFLSHTTDLKQNTDACEAVLHKLEFKWCYITGIEAAPALSGITEMLVWLQIKTVFILKLQCVRMKEVIPLNRHFVKLKTLKISSESTNFQFIYHICASSEGSAGSKGLLTHLF